MRFPFHTEIRATLKRPLSARHLHRSEIPQIPRYFQMMPPTPHYIIEDRLSGDSGSSRGWGARAFNVESLLGVEDDVSDGTWAASSLQGDPSKGSWRDRSNKPMGAAAGPFIRSSKRQFILMFPINRVEGSNWHCQSGLLRMAGAPCATSTDLCVNSLAENAWTLWIPAPRPGDP
jgi:hypothetical protein